MSVGLLRNCGRFIMGEWAQPVGRMCYEARKNATTPTSILSYGWKQGYKDYWAGVDAAKALQAKYQPKLMESINNAISGLGKNATAAAKKQAIEQAGKTFLQKATKKASAVDKKAITELVNKTVSSQTSTGFFSKIGKFLGKIPGMKFIGKNIFPIIIGVQTVFSAIEGYKDGGIGGALKEASRGLLQMGGYALATAVVAAFGAGPILGMILGGLFSSFVLDKGINLVLGKSPAEKREEAQLLAQQQGTQDTQSTNPFVLAAAKNSERNLTSFGSSKLDGNFDEKLKAIDAMIKPITNSMNNRHNYYMA